MTGFKSWFSTRHHPTKQQLVLYLRLRRRERKAERRGDAVHGADRRLRILERRGRLRREMIIRSYDVGKK